MIRDHRSEIPRIVIADKTNTQIREYPDLVAHIQFICIIIRGPAFSSASIYTFDEARSNMSDVVTSNEFETDLYDFNRSSYGVRAVLCFTNIPVTMISFYWLWATAKPPVLIFYFRS